MEIIIKAIHDERTMLEWLFYCNYLKISIYFFVPIVLMVLILMILMK